MTWQKLIQRALVPFEGRAGQLDKRAGLYMDEAQEDFALHTKCHVKKLNIFISSEKIYVDLPKDFIEMADMPVFKGKYLENNPSGAYDYNKEITTNNVTTGSPMEYNIQDKKFYFLPRPSSSGVLTITYVAVPSSLRSMQYLKKLRFDNVLSEYFDIGDVIKSRLGASNTTNSEATIERVDYDTYMGGVLTLSNCTNGFLTDDEDFFVSGSETAHYEALHGTDWNAYQTTWNNLGFGGLASVVGVQYDYEDTSPIVPDVYHYHLVDYAKAMIHQDLGNMKQFDIHYALYTANKEKARTTIANSDLGGPSFVADRISAGII